MFEAWVREQLRQQAQTWRESEAAEVLKLCSGGWRARNTLERLPFGDSQTLHTKQQRNTSKQCFNAQFNRYSRCLMWYRANTSSDTGAGEPVSNSCPAMATTITMIMMMMMIIIIIVVTTLTNS